MLALTSRRAGECYEVNSRSWFEEFLVDYGRVEQVVVEYTFWTSLYQNRLNV